MGRGNRRLSALSCEILSRKLRQICFFFFFHLFGAGQHQPKRHFQPKIVVKAFYLLLCLMYIYFVHTHAQPEWLVVAHTVHLRVDRRSAYDLRLRHYNYYNILPIEVAIVVYAACCLLLVLLLTFCTRWVWLRFFCPFFNIFFFCPLEPTQNSFAKRCVSNPSE